MKCQYSYGLSYQYVYIYFIYLEFSLLEEESVALQLGMQIQYHSI